MTVLEHPAVPATDQDLRRDRVRYELVQDLLARTGHAGHDWKYEWMQDDKNDPHSRLVVIWCVHEACKRVIGDQKLQGQPLAPVQLCLVVDCARCCPVTPWEKLLAALRAAFR